jgi:tetratricopeptide (TPR) repeat protein
VLARIAASARRYDLAERAASEALREDPTNSLAPTVLAWALAGQGKWDEALERFIRGGVFEDSGVRSEIMLLLMARWRDPGPVHPPAPPGFDPPTPAGDAKAASADRAPRRVVSALSRAYFAHDPAEMLPLLDTLSREAPGCQQIALGWAAALHLFGLDDRAEPWVVAALRLARASGSARGRAEDGEPNPEALLLAARVYAGTGDLKKATRFAERASATANPFDRWEARLVLADVREREGKRPEALGEACAALEEEPLAFGPALARVALRGVFEGLRDAVSLAESAGAASFARACRREMGLILGDPRPRARSRGLARALATPPEGLPADVRDLLTAYARRGVRSVLTRADDAGDGGGA